MILQCSDGRVLSAPASETADSNLIPSKPMNSKLVPYSLLPCLTLDIKRTVWRTRRQVYLLCRLKRQLAGFPHLGVLKRWPAIPKQARYSALIAFLYQEDEHATDASKL